MAPSRTKKGTRKASVMVNCPDCGAAISEMGLGRHRGSNICRTKQGGGVNLARVVVEEADTAFGNILDSYISSNTLNDTEPVAGPSRRKDESGQLPPNKHVIRQEFSSRTLDNSHVETAYMPDEAIDLNTQQSDDNTSINELSGHQLNQSDDIKIEFHPKSRRTNKTQIFRFDEYLPTLPAHTSNDTAQMDHEPYRPFRTRLDFELAEFMLNAHLNETQSADLLLLIRKCAENPNQFTLKNNKDLKQCWEFARDIKASGFSTISVTVPYKNEDKQFDMSFRPIWDWCLDLLQDPSLSGLFTWDAERHYKYDVTMDKWIQFIDEPWTGNAWWKIQSQLPEGASPFCIILYADKTKLSSFGTAKGYPVMARCANLPIEIRNGEGIGGGRIVGFLPVVAEDAGESGKKGYVNFKRVVWHKSFYEIIKSLENYAQTGFHFQENGVWRWIFPIILILSADYEEQCVMALIRGVNSDYPCPRCLVPGDQLINLAEKWPLRCSESMQEVYLDAQELNKTEADSLLQGYGLRNVENVFWKIQRSDVFNALSFDRLHNNHGGFFSDHLWETYKAIVDDLGKKTAAEVDHCINQIPRWSGLNHFLSLMKTSGEYTDGTKYEDISKIIIFASQDILTPNVSKQGFLLLELMRSYLELDMFASLTVHTEQTLNAGEVELKIFSKILKKYASKYPEKSWNFPKAHAFQHLFDDIREKGVTRNYNTKPNEKAHGILKVFYELTNFKNIIPQIIRLNEADLACQIIRLALDQLDERISASKQQDNSEKNEPIIIGTHHVSLGSPSPSISLANVENEFINDTAFKNFRRKLSKAVSSHFNKTIRLDYHQMISPFKYLKVNYESQITWKEEQNILRVNPDFHGRPRYDYVLIQIDDSGHNPTYIFAQLVYIFGISIGPTDIRYMALIIPMDEPVQISQDQRARDSILRLTRIRSRRRSRSTFINIESIVRGGLVVQAFKEGEQADEYLIMDIIDEDMWWRMKSVSLIKQANI